MISSKQKTTPPTAVPITTPELFAAASDFDATTGRSLIVVSSSFAVVALTLAVFVILLPTFEPFEPDEPDDDDDGVL
jgi:hypothetical protein